MSEIHHVDPTVDERWDGLARNRGSLFTSPCWLRAMRDTYGFTYHAAIEVSDGAATAGLAWCEVDDLRGQRIVGLPFCDYADPVFSQSSDWCVLSAGLDTSVPLRFRTRDIDMAAVDSRFRATARTAWHGIDISRSPDEMWQSLDESAKRAIRKAQKSGIEIRAAETVDDLRSFYAMHSRVRREKYGLLAQPFALITHAFSGFDSGGDALLLIASIDGVDIASTFYLRWGDTLYYKFNASSADGLAVRPNDLLVWTGMMRGHELGLSRLDFGQSDLDQPGLLRYKEKFATEVGTITTYVREPDGWQDNYAQAAGETLSGLTQLLTRDGVPDWLYEQAGELLYRNFC